MLDWTTHDEHGQTVILLAVPYFIKRPKALTDDEIATSSSSELIETGQGT
jgi:hypothetical protein